MWRENRLTQSCGHIVQGGRTFGQIQLPNDPTKCLRQRSELTLADGLNRTSVHIACKNTYEKNIYLIIVIPHERHRKKLAALFFRKIFKHINQQHLFFSS